MVNGERKFPFAVNRELQSSWCTVELSLLKAPLRTGLEINP